MTECFTKKIAQPSVVLLQYSIAYLSSIFNLNNGNLKKCGFFFLLKKISLWMNFWALFWPKVQKQQGSYDLSLDDNIGIQALVYNHVVKYRISFNTQYPTDSYFVYVPKMEYRWNFWLKVSFSIIINPTKIFFEIPPCAKNVIFITEFVFLDINPHFY